MGWEEKGGGLRVRAQHGDGSAGNPPAEVLDHALDVCSGAVRSPASVGLLALGLCSGFLLELYRGQRCLPGLVLFSVLWLLGSS